MNTQEVKTKNGHVAILKQEMTGADVEDATDIISEAVKASDKLHAMINTVVISVDGSNENIVQKMRDLPSTDYNEIVTVVTGVYTGVREVSEEKKDVEKL